MTTTLTLVHPTESCRQDPTPLQREPNQKIDGRSIMAALGLLQSAVAHLQANELDQAHTVLQQVVASSPASGSIQAVALWLQGEINDGRAAGPAHRPLNEPHPGFGQMPDPPTSAVIDRYALSERERDVLELVSRGFSSQQIAIELFISKSTVGYHLGNMFAKTGVTSRHQLTAMMWEGTARSA